MREESIYISGLDMVILDWEMDSKKKNGGKDGGERKREEGRGVKECP